MPKDVSLLSDYRGDETPDAERTVSELVKVLSRALRTLGNSRHADTASRLAAQAWVLCRHDHPVAAERLNGLMHYLARVDPSPVAGPDAHTAPKERMVTADPELDVRAEPAGRRHELFFDRCASLAVGAAFVLVNDHDPKPLSYQLHAENPGQFNWAYLEEGPQVWRVRISRTADTGSTGR